MKLVKRFELGENMLYSLVWVAIFLIPFMNAQLMSEHQVDFNKVVISWGKVAPYFIIFIVNNILLAPRLLLRNRYHNHYRYLVAIGSSTYWLLDVG